LTASLLLPGLLAVGFGVAAGFHRWRMRPSVAVWVLSGIAALTAITALTVLLTFVVGFAARSSSVLALIEWCPAIPVHHEVGLGEGLIASFFLLVTLLRWRNIALQRRWACEGTSGLRFRILETEEPIAYAAPGRPGCVVVSDGLLGALDPRERQVLFAHERAHLHLKHHHFLLVGELATATIPLLKPLVGQLRLATERCADEAAVAAMDGDREVVASSIARAALATTYFQGAVAPFGGGSIPIRIRSVLGGSADVPLSRRGITVLLFGLATTASLSTLQIHHIVALVRHACGA
jgi:Zn-dependent protease with chaperone function